MLSTEMTQVNIDIRKGNYTISFNSDRVQIRVSDLEYSLYGITKLRSPLHSTLRWQEVQLSSWDCQDLPINVNGICVPYWKR